MAIEDFGGEVLGHKVELVSADQQNKPDLAVSIARRWYDADGVDMITELTTSTVALAVQELSNEKKIDIVVGAATSRITVLANGRMMHDMYLFEVKKPSESKKLWDYYKQLAAVPRDQAFFTAKESGCPLTK